jgi:hypothetical protein
MAVSGRRRSTDQNEQLTVIAGASLIVLLAVIGVTIVRIGQLISVHLFVGLVLLGPLLLKMASTGYRFARYYAHDPAYRAKGPPLLALRLIAPVVVISTLTVFISGILLMLAGPGGKDRYLALHKVSFIVWLVFTGLHVLGHLPVLLRGLRPRENATVTRLDGAGDGAAGRWIALVGAVVGGVVLAVALIPDFAAWTAHTA